MDIAFAGDVMFQLYVDDFNRVGYLDILDSKGDVFDKWVELAKALKNRYNGWDIAFIRTDNEFVYTADCWRTWCSEVGCEHEFCPKHRQ